MAYISVTMRMSVQGRVLGSIVLHEFCVSSVWISTLVGKVDDIAEQIFAPGIFHICSRFYIYGFSGYIINYNILESSMSISCLRKHISGYQK